MYAPGLRDAAALALHLYVWMRRARTPEGHVHSWTRDELLTAAAAGNGSRRKDWSRELTAALHLLEHHGLVVRVRHPECLEDPWTLALEEVSRT